MSNIKIFVSYHKKCFVPHNKLLFPIQVGAAISSERFENMLHDDEGDNISAKNPNYCELTAQYWAWKNADADYYGFFHYRRYMSFAKGKFPANNFEDIEIDYLTDKSIQKLGINEDEMQELINKYDVITTTPANIKKQYFELKNNYEQYSDVQDMHAEDVDILLEIIREKYPDYYDTAYNYFYKLPYGYFCNMFIMKKDIFMDYSKWLFDILEEHGKRRDYSNYTAEGYRVSDHLGERLFGIYYEQLKKKTDIKTCELQRALFKNTRGYKTVEPVFEENAVPIVIASNDYYVPYVSTLLLSIKDTVSADNNYDIVLLSSDITAENMKILSDIILDPPNISLRITDPGALLSGYQLFTRGHFSRETYYRLILQDLMPSYNKVLWFDVDMIILEDPARLYETDMKGYLIGGVYDADTSGLYNGYMQGKKEYMDKELKLKDPYSYFQAGTLIFNLEEFRKKYTVQQILELAQSKEWELLDQDILNVLCEGSVKYIDMSWNVMFDYAGVRIKEIISRAPVWQYNLYMKARKNPKIIHYAGPEKPWLNPESDYGELYWEYAKRSPYYEIMLWRMSRYAYKYERKIEEELDKQRRDKKGPIYKTIRCLFLYGPKHTFNEIKDSMSKSK
ncbi:MAG: DUF4422 domain-containing protein [Butyrivibrio sp.]|nr:DUF4422 domain-containing protein [Butyrivibrio sp.]